MAMEPSIAGSMAGGNQVLKTRGHDKERLAYNARIARMRDVEYPQLRDQTYLDHAGTTIPPASLMSAFAQDLTNFLYGNPHSFGSSSAQRTSSRIDDVRPKVLRLFNASPDDYEVVFVANATAGIKLVAEAFANQSSGFNCLYHKDSHTSLVGVRELASQSLCLETDQEVENWLARDRHGRVPSLLAYPAQSNMNGRRLPLHWCGRARARGIYTLLDAAALVSSSPLDLGHSNPDLVVMSFYKIFGFPDLGALLIKKDVGHFFHTRNYFGGGTVETVSCEAGESWHFKKAGLHQSLEDGTLPIHNIIALDLAIDNHSKLFGGFEHISKHTAFLAYSLYQTLQTLRHGNGSQVCDLYNEQPVSEGKWNAGPFIALNFRDIDGAYISTHEVLKLASVKNIHIRTGNLCNPGGVSRALQMSAKDLKDKYCAGIRCGGDQDLLNGRPTGVIRISFGAMSTLDDVQAFVSFVQEFFVQDSTVSEDDKMNIDDQEPSFFIESLVIYPIKSCGGFTVSKNIPWSISSEGLTWDRVWCLIHQGTRAVLNQKRHPQLAWFRPDLDFQNSVMHISWKHDSRSDLKDSITIPLEFRMEHFRTPRTSNVVCSTSSCTDQGQPLIYGSPELHEFFSTHLGVPVYLARRPGTSLLDQRLEPRSSMPGTFPTPPPSPSRSSFASPSQIPPNLSLANESPILILFKQSLDIVNSLLPQNTPLIPVEAFRANIILGSTSPPPVSHDSANLSGPLRLIEDNLTALSRLPEMLESRDSELKLELLSPCRRCQMISIDQDTGQRRPEVFSHLAKLRRWNGGVWFGVHASLAHGADTGAGPGKGREIRVGDVFRGSLKGKDVQGNAG